MTTNPPSALVPALVLIGLAQAARVPGWARDCQAQASALVTVGRGVEELVHWGCLYEHSSEDSSTLVGIDLGIALGTEPSAAD